MKIFYFDVETTGLDPRGCAIIQLAYIVEVDGIEKERGNLLIRPHAYAVIEDSALRVNGRTRHEINTEPFMHTTDAYSALLAVLDKYVDRYNRDDKFYPAGYNVGFDCAFLEQFFIRAGNKYYASYFQYLKLDPSCMMIHAGVDLPNYKLATVCKNFCIELDAHDAMSDISATRELLKRITVSIDGNKTP